MEIDKGEFQSSLNGFFNDCEKTLLTFDTSDIRENLIEYEYQSNGSEKLLKRHPKEMVSWDSLFWDFHKKIQEKESMDLCVQYIIQIFGLRKSSDNDGCEITDDKLISKNKEYYKIDLCNLYFSYIRDYADQGISVEKFSDFIVERCFSSNLYCNKTARLLGFNYDSNFIKIGNLELRIPDGEVISKIVNDSLNKTFPSSITSFYEIAFGPKESSIHNNEYWIFKNEMEKIKEPDNIYKIINHNNAFWPHDINDPDIYRLILSLRLFGLHSGIRTIHSKYSLNKESIDYEYWHEFFFKINSKFHPVCNLEFGKYPTPLNEKSLTQDEIDQLIDIYDFVEKYQSSNISYIDQSLEHYFLSYEQKYPAYTFTELMLAFESLFGEFIPQTDDDLNSLICDIRKIDDIKALNKFKAFLNRNSAQKSIKRLQLLLNLEGREAKNFNKLFYNNNKTGCYQLRNSLLHGNICLDHQEIYNKIPQLNEFIRKGLLKIIQSYVNDELKITEPNYYEELDKFIEIKAS